MGHPVLLGRDCWMRFDTRVFLTLSQRGPGGRTMDELTLLRLILLVGVLTPLTVKPLPCVQLRFVGQEVIDLFEETSLVDVNLVRYSGLPALAEDYLVSLVPRIFLLPRRTFLFRRACSVPL